MALTSCGPFCCCYYMSIFAIRCGVARFCASFPNANGKLSWPDFVAHVRHVTHEGVNGAGRPNLMAARVFLVSPPAQRSDNDHLVVAPVQAPLDARGDDPNTIVDRFEQ